MNLCPYQIQLYKNILFQTASPKAHPCISALFTNNTNFNFHGYSGNIWVNLLQQRYLRSGRARADLLVLPGHPYKAAPLGQVRT